MKPLLVVDGYNVIGAWILAMQKKWPVEECREQLRLRVEAYAIYHGYEAVLVFDGTRGGRKVRSEAMEGAVMVIYTRMGETADHYIERLCDGQPKRRDVYVATSDAVEQTVVLGRGALRMPARELLHSMDQMKTAQQSALDKGKVSQNRLIDRLPAAQREALERMRRGDI